MEVYVQLLIYLAAPAIIALIAWVGSQQVAIHNLKLHVAEQYIKKDDVADIKKDLKTMTKMMYRVSGKLGLPMSEDD